MRSTARAGDRGADGCRASTSSTPAAAFLPLQDEVFPERNTSGDLLTTGEPVGRGIPQVAVVMDRARGGAYGPAMCDESIIVKNQGTIFLGGPPLVKAATGEVVERRDLGGGDVAFAFVGRDDNWPRRPARAPIAREIIRPHLIGAKRGSRLDAISPGWYRQRGSDGFRGAALSATSSTACPAPTRATPSTCGGEFSHAWIDRSQIGMLRKSRMPSASPRTKQRCHGRGFVLGDEHRLLCRRPRSGGGQRGETAWIVGDGRSAIAELIGRQLHSDPRRGPHDDSR